MIRPLRSLALVALLAGVSAACSSDSKTTAPTTERTVTQATTQARTESTPVLEPPLPPAARPPGLRKRQRVYAKLARARDRGLSGPAVYRKVAEQEGIGVESVVLIEHEGSLRRWRLPQAPKLPPAAVRVPRSRAAARSLRSTVGCSPNAPRTGVASLRWQPSRRGTTNQWVVVTIFLRGFALGSFEASAPLPPRASSFAWHRVHGQAIHRWRVITRDRSGRWLGSATARFTGPTCIAEFQP